MGRKVFKLYLMHPTGDLLLEEFEEHDELMAIATFSEYQRNFAPNQYKLIEVES